MVEVSRLLELTLGLEQSVVLELELDLMDVELVQERFRVREELLGGGRTARAGVRLGGEAAPSLPQRSFHTPGLE